MNNRTTEDIVGQIKQLNQEINTDQNSYYASLQTFKDGIARLTDVHNRIHKLLNETQCVNELDRVLLRTLKTTHEEQKPAINELRQLNSVALRLANEVIKTREAWTGLLEVFEEVFEEVFLINEQSNDRRHSEPNQTT